MNDWVDFGRKQVEQLRMTKHASMRAVEIADGKLIDAVLPIPTLAAGEVLVRVAYAGINRADLLQRDGKYPAPEGASPLPGLEVSGYVEAVADGVIGWNIGEQVCALLSGGGYAEYVAVPAGQLLPLPNSISLRQGATLPEAAATTLMALRMEANIQPGERVLIHGGTSGLGLPMVQIAKAWGAEVFTTVGSDEKVKFLEQFEAHAINHRSAPFAEQIMTLTKNEGIDVIVDILGAPQFATHLSLLRKGGRMVSLAMMEGATLENARIGRMLTHHLRWSGATLRSRSTAQKAEIMHQVHDHIWPHVATGAIKPVIDRDFSLSDAEKALLRMQERLHLGKILLEVAPK